MDLIVKIALLTDFVRTSPNLEKFVRKIYDDRSSRSRRKLESAVKYPHQHLKVIELHGCCGNTNELEFIMYFLENAASLEKIIINTRAQWFLEMTWMLQGPVTEEEHFRRYLHEELEAIDTFANDKSSRGHLQKGWVGVVVASM